MRGIGRRLGAVGVRRRDQFVGGPAPGYTRLYNAITVGTPITLWWFMDNAWLTLSGADITGCEDAWKGGAVAHNLATATNPPSFSDGSGAVFVGGDTERLQCDFSAGAEAAGDWIMFCKLKAATINTGVLSVLGDCTAGRLGVFYHNTSDDVAYNDGASQSTGTAAAAGEQHLVYVFNGTANTGKCYRNGVDIGGGSYNTDRGLNNTMTIGAVYNASSGWWTGTMACFGIVKGSSLVDAAAIGTVLATL